MNEATIRRLAQHYRQSADDMRAEVTHDDPWSMDVARAVAAAYEEALRSLQRLAIDPNVALPTDVVWERPDATCARCGAVWTPERDDLVPEGYVCEDCQDKLAAEAEYLASDECVADRRANAYVDKVKNADRSSL